MKKEYKILTLLLISVFIISLFAAAFVSAETDAEKAARLAKEAAAGAPTAPSANPTINVFLGGKLATTGPPQESAWYKVFTDWMGFGETWALILSSLFVMLILVSGIYDILLGFGAFSNKYVIFLIAFGVGGIAAVSGAVRAVAVFLFSIGAFLGAGAVLFGILVPLVIFVIVNVLFFRIFNELRTKKAATEIKSGADTAAAAAEALGRVGAGFRKGAKAAEA